MPLKTFGEFIRRRVLNNFTAKVMALAMALGVWLYAYIGSYTEYKDFQIPVRLHVAEGWSAVHGDHLVATVKLSYPVHFESQFTQDLDEGKTYLDCNVAPQPGALDHDAVGVPLSKDLLVTSRDFSLKIMSFKPADLQIELIRETTRMVPVLPNISAPPPGYRVEYAYPLMAAVMIRGQEDIVAALVKSGVETEKIDISPPPPDVSEWDLEQVPAGIPSSVTVGGKSYPISCSDHVAVHIHLVRESKVMNFTDVPIGLLLPANYPYIATPLRAGSTDVEVTGPQKDVDALKKKDIVLYVDLRDPTLVPQDTPYTQPVYAQVVDEHQRPVTAIIVRPAASTCAVKIEAKPK